MPIPPVDPADIAGAAPYNVQLSSFKMPLCKAQFVPMQFTFNTNLVWSVDLSQRTPGDNFGQLCALYVDASDTLHDLTLIFPDSGFTAIIPFGGTKMLNVITTKDSPKFYVKTNTDFKSPDDVVNIYAINTPMPPDTVAQFQKVISYGYGQFFELTTPLVASTSFATINTIASAVAGKIGLIAATQFFINAIIIDFEDITNTAAQNVNIVLYDGDGVTAILYTTAFFPVSVGGAGAVNSIRLTGLNFVSNGTGNLQIALFPTIPADITAGFITTTIFGGVLIA